MVTQEMLDQEERKDAKQIKRRALEFCKEVEISHRRQRASRRQRSEGPTPMREGGVCAQRLSPSWLA